MRRSQLTALALGGVFCAAAARAEEAPFMEEVLNLRDPFKRPASLGVKAPVQSELEAVSIEEIRLVGVITGPDRVRAMIALPNGQTHFIAEKQRLGTRQGVVTKITANSIWIREKIVNVLGQEEAVVTEMRVSGKNGNTGDLAGGSPISSVLIPSQAPPFPVQGTGPKGGSDPQE